MSQTSNRQVPVVPPDIWGPVKNPIDGITEALDNLTRDIKSLKEAVHMKWDPGINKDLSSGVSISGQSIGRARESSRANPEHICMGSKVGKNREQECFHCSQLAYSIATLQAQHAVDTLNRYAVYHGIDLPEVTTDGYIRKWTVNGSLMHQYYADELVNTANNLIKNKLEKSERLKRAQVFF